MRRKAQPQQAGGGQDYLASVSDLMSGLIFIFIITLAVFALRLAQAQQQAKLKEDQYTDSQKVRNEIVEQIRDRLADSNVNVEVDDEYGIVRLTDETIGFDIGKDVPRPEHRGNVATVAHALSHVLRCYVVDSGGIASLDDCSEHPGGARVDTVMIEGHTDSAPIAGGDNLDLSASRSARILRYFEQDEPVLSNFKNMSGKPVLSVSGYGETRPVNKVDTRAAENRRIDIRFVMELPRETQASEPRPVTETREEIGQ